MQSTFLSQDTIAALATPQGVGAIAVLRLSGKQAIDIADAVFYGKKLSEQTSHSVHFGTIKNEQQEIIDEVLVSVFKAPRSYTKENVVEISCHGSPYIIQELLQLFVRQGARLAKPGEFTMRAFMNGGLDLSQAEAVADLIASENAAAHRVALQQLRGGFSKEIQQLRQQLIDFAALIELELDFGEEDVEFANRKDLELLISNLQKHISQLLQSFQLGNAMKNGVPVAIVGKPNAGKSTLLNALLNEEKAIVSPIAGTTRDVVEDILLINGLQFRIMDTAGLRQTEDSIEAIGVERTLAKMETAQLILYIYDASNDAASQVAQVQSFKMDYPQAHIFFVVNKIDELGDVQVDLGNGFTVCKISAKTKQNVQLLKDKMYEAVLGEAMPQTLLSNARHVEALQSAQASLSRSLEAIKNHKTGDLIALDLRHALHALGEITGEISSEDLLDSIFTRFCIGK